MHSPLCSGFAGMPGHLVPGRPVLAGTFLLFWECTGVFIRLSVRVGYLTRSNIFCVHYAQALGINVIVLKTQDAGFSLCSVPGAPQSHFYLVDDSLIFFFFLLFFFISPPTSRFRKDFWLNGKSVLGRQKTFFSGGRRIRSAARTPASWTVRRKRRRNTTPTALEQNGTGS